jgi:hypothetical protein
MRGAFVVQLGSKSQPAECQFEGWVEEVDSGRQLRFRSTEELIAFLGRRLEAASPPQGPQEKDEPCGKE